MLKYQRERERERASLPLGYKYQKGGQAIGNLPSVISQKGGQRYSLSLGGNSYGY